ncbi:MAG: cytochrome c biogenesis protein CcdA [Anaerolineae bacterium]|nr:cytochrome c biogenesis protein CcdA [Anaerolineae bacterium]MDW8102689.1 cytochrome c biogenesis protein CcdA [Anaerolineae bacterium]
MEPQKVNLLVALSAGVLSFLSPCVLPVIPAFIGYLSGVSLEEKGNRRKVFFHALSLVLGFSFAFTLMGASAGALGQLLKGVLPLIQKVGGIMIVLFGMHVMGLLKIPVLYQEKKIPFNPGAGAGYGASFLAGIVFSVGWTPCVGPILAAILLMAGNSATAWEGALLLVAYSLGLGIPFLAVGAALLPLSRWLRRASRYGNYLSWITGVFLIVVGFLLFTDTFRLLGGL